MSPQSTDTIAQVDLHHPRFRFLLAQCRGLPRLPVGVVHPCSAVALQGALDAASHGLIEPWLFGPETHIRRLADTLGLGLEGVTILDAPDAHSAAQLAVMAGRRGDVAAPVEHLGGGGERDPGLFREGGEGDATRGLGEVHRVSLAPGFASSRETYDVAPRGRIR